MVAKADTEVVLPLVRSLKMSAPAFAPASTPSAPVAASVPLFAGDWMTT